MGLNVQDTTKRFLRNLDILADKITGPLQSDSQVLGGDGAISIKNGPVALTKGTALAATLAAPTDVVDDGARLDIFSTTAAAHVITFASGKINGGTNITVTFGAAIGTGVTLYAKGGIWYTQAQTGTVTVA